MYRERVAMEEAAARRGGGGGAASSGGGISYQAMGRPDSKAPPPPSGSEEEEEGEALPKGWSKIVDPSGMCYFREELSGCTTMDRPKGEAAEPHTRTHASTARQGSGFAKLPLPSVAKKTDSSKN